MLDQLSLYSDELTEHLLSAQANQAAESARASKSAARGGRGSGGEA